jgi:uncharacterized cupin superfamily protein
MRSSPALRYQVSDMPTRPDFIGHWTEIERREPIRYPGDPEPMGLEASVGEKLGLTRIGIHHMRVPPGGASAIRTRRAPKKNSCS